ncbi:MAG: FoF1 ATP synthase subunit gamma, partial [Oscillospiraceae bacterium]
MAGASMKDIKLRIKSVESTMQITKAMELVASSKLRKAKLRVEKCRPYFETIHEALADIAYSNTEFASPFVTKRTVKKTCYVMIAGDRGLAGGYNTNLFKTVRGHMADKSVCVLPIGKKAHEYALRNKFEIVSDLFCVAEDVGISKCFEISKILADGFLKGNFDEIYLGYTNFVSMLSQEAAVLKILPIRYDREQAKEPTGAKALIIYEPSSEEVYNSIVPDYISGMIYGGLC